MEADSPQPDTPPAPGLPLPDPGETTLSAEYAAAHAVLPAQLPSGGDFHDAFPLGDGSGDVAVVIGDVAGHGPEQTAQADHMRALLADSLTVGLSPAEALAAVNAMIEPDPHFAGFGTVFVGTVEAETGRLTYASGGHEPALIAPTAGGGVTAEEVVELEGTGPPVGAFPAGLARFEQREAVVPPGGTLLLYTDGIPDAHPPGDRLAWLGLGRLKAILARAAGLPPRRLVAAVLARVARWCRGRFDDDIALLALRRRPDRPSSRSGPNSP